NKHTKAVAAATALQNVAEWLQMKCGRALSDAPAGLPYFCCVVVIGAGFFAAALAARSAAFCAATSGVVFRPRPSARLMSATCGLRFACCDCLDRRCASEYVVSASMPAALRAVATLNRTKCASASS